MALTQFKVILVCHYPEAFPDLLPLYELLISKRIDVSFLFTDGYLLGPDDLEGRYLAQEIKATVQQYYSRSIKELDMCQLTQIKNNYDKNNLVFFLSTHYLNSLSLALQEILTSSRIFYAPYGYPVRLIENELFIKSTDGFDFDWIFVQDKMELGVWEQNTKSRVVVSRKPFSYKKTSLVENLQSFDINRVCLSLHHNSTPEKISTGRGTLVYHLDSLLDLIERNDLSYFVIRTHPIFLSKLRSLSSKNPESSDLLASWSHFAAKVNAIPNAAFSSELDWEKDFASSAIVFTESPSLAIKGRLRFKYSSPISLRLNPEIHNSNLVDRIYGIKVVSDLKQVQKEITKRRSRRYFFILGKFASYLHISIYQHISRQRAWRDLRRAFVKEA
jgi:hypothetical protein